MGVASDAIRIKKCTGTYNRMVPQVLRPLRDFAPSYIDDIFVHSRTEGNLSDVQVHLRHLKQMFQIMQGNKLYANLKKCSLSTGNFDAGLLRK